MAASVRGEEPGVGAARVRPASVDPLVPPDLGMVSLEEMTEHAALMTRVDRKYVLDRSQVAEVLSGVDSHTRVLETGGVRTQAYRSTYFDTPDRQCFRATAHPRRRRFKVRTRTYVDSGTAFLEVKTRGPRGTTVKERTGHPLSREEDPDVLSGADLVWLESVLARVGQSAGTAASLTPVLRGSYSRTAMLMPDEGGRATVDSHLVWRTVPGTACEGQESVLSRPDLVIIETKSGSSPSHLDRLLWSAGHRPVRLSKFATALAVLDPSLPSNRWVRVMRERF